MAHLWVALLAHRRADPNQPSILIECTESACQLMKELLMQGLASTTPKAARKGLSPKVVAKVMSPKIARVGKIVSPRATRATRLRIPAAPKKAPPAKTRTKAKASADPVTPKAPAPMGKLTLFYYHSTVADTVFLPLDLPPVTFKDMQTPPRQSTGAQGGKSMLLFDDFDKFLSLLRE